jgi:hypothetical protein
LGIQITLAVKTAEREIARRRAIRELSGRG